MFIGTRCVVCIDLYCNVMWFTLYNRPSPPSYSDVVLMLEVVGLVKYFYLNLDSKHPMNPIHEFSNANVYMCFKLLNIEIIVKTFRVKFLYVNF